MYQWGNGKNSKIGSCLWLGCRLFTRSEKCKIGQNVGLWLGFELCTISEIGDNCGNGGEAVSGVWAVYPRRKWMNMVLAYGWGVGCEPQVKMM